MKTFDRLVRMYTMYHWTWMVLLVAMRMPLDTWVWDYVRANQCLISTAVVYLYIRDRVAYRAILMNIAQSLVPNMTYTTADAINVAVHIVPLLVLGIPRTLAATVAASLTFAAWYAFTREDLDDIYAYQLQPEVTDGLVFFCVAAVTGFVALYR